MEQRIWHCLEIEEALGDRSGMASPTGSLGEVELGRGNLDQAEALLKDALERFTDLGNRQFIAECNFRLAQVWQKRGTATEAQSHYGLAHPLSTELGALKDLGHSEQA